MKPSEVSFIKVGSVATADPSDLTTATTNDCNTETNKMSFYFEEGVLSVNPNTCEDRLDCGEYEVKSVDTSPNALQACCLKEEVAVLNYKNGYETPINAVCCLELDDQPSPVGGHFDYVLVGAADGYCCGGFTRICEDIDGDGHCDMGGTYSWEIVGNPNQWGCRVNET